MLSAILLGGGYIKQLGIPKARFKVGGRTLLDIALSACDRAKSVDEIIVICPEEFAQEARRYAKVSAVVPAGEDLIGRIYEALAKARGEDILILPIDLPFITENTIDGFVAECRRYQVNGYYPILRKEFLEREFPGTKRTYAKLKDGVLTGGNIFLIKKRVLLENRDFVEDIYEARKNPYRMARVAGLKVFLKGVLGLLTVADAEKRVSRLVGAPLKAVFTQYPEIGIDIDKPEDVEFVQRRVGAPHG